jgi:hypothetical protein
MFLRCYLLLRLVRDNSQLYNKKAIVFQSGYRERGGPPRRALAWPSPG